jgi:plastocyanin
MPEVKIAVLNDLGDMSYSTSVLHVSAGDTITWKCEHGPIAITFGDRSPLVEGYQVRSPNSGPFIAAGTVKPRDQVTPGVYYYRVGAQKNGRIYLDAGCPQIVVV